MKGICDNCKRTDYLYRIHIKFLDNGEVTIQMWCKFCLHNEKPPEEKK